MSRVVVIGAGIGGMCAAARLAKAGHSVDIYESSHFVGGKCRTEWIGKYAFDTGPSLLTLPAVYRDFFLKTGEPIERVLELQHLIIVLPMEQVLNSLTSHDTKHWLQSVKVLVVGPAMSGTRLWSVLKKCGTFQGSPLLNQN